MAGPIFDPLNPNESPATKYQKKMVEKQRKNNPYVMGDMEHGGGREKPKKTD